MSDGDESKKQESAGGVDARAASESGSEAESEKVIVPPRGVEEHVDSSKLQPDTTTSEALASLKEKRMCLAEDKKRLTRDLRKMRRVKERIKKKATCLSQQDLCQIIAMKQDLANQFKEKKAAAQAAKSKTSSKSSTD